MATTKTETYKGYSLDRIPGGVAVYLGKVTNVAHAARIFATTSEARRWVDARPC